MKRQETHSLDAPAAQEAPRGRSRRRRVRVTAAAAAVVLLGGAFTYFNTNVLNSGRICHGWASPQEAGAALGGGIGRVSASEDSASSCTVEVESWLPGRTKKLNLRAEAEPSGFPFSKGAWEISGARHVLSGGTHGAYDAYGGWALLPTACENAATASGTSPALRAAVIGKSARGDADGMRRLLTSAARARADSTDCTASGHADGATRSSAPSTAGATDLDAVCGINGFRLPGAQSPQGRRIDEQVTGTLRQGLYCDLTFEGEEKGAFAHLAVVSDPALVAALKGRDFTRARCDGKETVLAYDLRYFGAAERAATHLPDAAGFSKAFDDAARTALSCR
ncbi:hypothetical protein G3I40_40640 [Streptomyces sp. SID14478]|uniref:hypothetical protein n=1 Tax=Streptomyces sp. SID14478 TaxID=2706073 RepID=UPI0013E00F7B|nr:hypothetical protein [Streptomyces sp. SID14478]NEB81476.1 hypothetical protein [Streptomyces sp. SID14478]